VSEKPTIATWMGKPLEDLTREELMEAVLFLGQALDTSRENHLGSLNVMQAMTRRRTT